ncbi:MAG: phosphoenolpyruvate--protein phosphotransferase, partial [Chitinivibrionales bacterium]|nr:phosphoenolpyruvate--protein phosphotransferase [Chitinivibrionales bacterium]MBD3358567.1 phosphoenolpyruvate--protein phosphotransferase [Chitinivibrionales bacterium]
MPDPVKLICDISELNWVFTDSRSIDVFLERVVELVSRHLQAEVCSAYLFDGSRHKLVLRATKGLAGASVGKVELALGEGITGVALKELRPLKVDAGSTHPAYKHIRGINEEVFDAFLAVPILRGIRRIGVLVVQRKAENPFADSDVALLQAVTSQLANIVENTRLLISLRDHVPLRDKPAPVPVGLIKGRTASAGYARGHVRRFDRASAFNELANHRYAADHTEADLRRAIAKTEHQLEVLQERIGERLIDAASLIFAAHLLVLKDDAFVGAMLKMTREGIAPAEAVLRVGTTFVDALSAAPDQYFRSRADDIRDLVLRITSNLVGEVETGVDYAGHVVVAPELFPSDILTLVAEGAGGIVQASGGAASHTAILARALGIPLVIANVPGLMELSPTTMIILDADHGNVYIDPSPKIIDSFETARAVAAEATKANRKGAAPTPRTKDGTGVTLLANVNLLSDLKGIAQLPCHGIGLYRSEFPFLIRSDFPSEEEQYAVYRKLIERAPPNGELTFRTLDIGGDKVLSYYENLRENNPFLGMRSIRFTLENTEIFRRQARAILRAAVDIELRIMFPMISSIDELRHARALVDECREELKAVGVKHNTSPSIGIMVELPSVLETIEAFAREADFFSIGTNDFVQYMLAVDRTNERVASLYLAHHPAVLRGIHRTLTAARAADIPLSICGEMAHESRYLPLLLGMGVRRFSVDP